MSNSSNDYLPCTVAVASFTPNAEAIATIEGALWWPYANLVDDNSGTTLLINGAPLGANVFKMSSSVLNFKFSSDNVVQITANGGGAGGHDVGPEPVKPPTLTLHLYVKRVATRFTVSMIGEPSVQGGFLFGGVLYPLQKPINLVWPT